MTDSNRAGSNRGCYLAVLLALIVGIVLGTLLGAKYRPNHTIVWLENSKKVFISPHEGDVIDWGSQNGDLKQISFLGSIPCKEVQSGASTDIVTRCTFQSPPAPSGVKNDKRTYSYACVGNKISIACQDPGVGPKSITGVPLDGEKFFLLRWIDRFFTYFVSLFSNFEMPTGVSTEIGSVTPQESSMRSAQPEIKPSIPTTGKPSVTATEGRTSASPLATADTPSPYITCNRNAPYNALLFPDPATKTPGPDVNIARLSTVQWESDIDFSFNVNSGTCNPDTTTLKQNNSTCSVTNSAMTQPNITITTTGCAGSNTVQMNLNIHQ